VAEGAVPERDLERLYGLPLSDFTRARDATARRLRRAGERDAADAATALRKPSLSAWTVNQLVRHERTALDEVLAAGDAVRKAMEKADREALSRAAEREEEALREAVGRARGLLEDAGERSTEATLARVSQTLRAAANDPDARREVLCGMLVRDIEPAGLGTFAAAMPAAPSTRRRQRSKTPAARRSPARPASSDARALHDARERARRELESCEREEHDAQTALEAARRDEAHARQAAEEAEEAAHAAGRRAREARTQHEAAKSSAAEARRRLEEAERALRDA
jgi:hypothetical protein